MKTKLRYFLKRMLLILFIVIVTAVMSAYVYQKIIDTEQNRCWQILEDTAASITRGIEIQLTDNINIMRLVANAAVQEDREKSQEAVVEYISAFQPSTIFSRIDVMYADGTALLQTGEIIELEENFDLEKMTEKDFYISSRVTDAVSEKEVVQCSVPIRRDGSVKAALVGIIECDTLPQYFEAEAYGGNAVACIVDSADGNFIMDDWHNTLGNMYEMESRKMIPQYQGVDLIEDVKSHKTGAVAYVSEKNKNISYMYYTPIGIEDWELLIIVQENVAFAGVIALKQYIAVFVAVELLLLLLYLLWGAYSTDQLLKGKEATEEQLHISKVLNECTRELASHSDVDVAVNNLLKIITEFFGGDRAYICRIDYDKESVSNTYEYAAEGVTKEIDNLQDVPLEAIKLWLFRFKQSGSFYISDIDKDVDGKSITYDILIEQNIHSLLAVPLLKEEEIVGFLGVDNPPMNKKMPELLDSIQFFIMEALERKERHVRLEQLSIMDGLTNVFNRHQFNTVVEKYVEENVGQIGIAYFDTNGLKEINDTQGHDVGDRLIISISKIIDGVFPKQTFRIGGDEFTVLTDDITEENFNKKVQLIEERFEKAGLSVACGVCFCREAGELEKGMQEADYKMYVSKNSYYEKHNRRKNDET